MKKIIYPLAVVMLFSFSNRRTMHVDGLWTGFYKADNVRERVLVKFDQTNQIELYNGEVNDNNRFAGSYEVQGDTLLILSFRNTEGKEYTMQGTFNKKRTYVDGIWQTSDKLTGSFYLKKENLEERIVQP